MAIPFCKMQGVGNDFVVIEKQALGLANASELAIQTCDRHMGIGADGLLVVSAKDASTVLMEMHNPDGTEDVCGNGMRCVARYAYERMGITADMTIETLAGPRAASVSTVNPSIVTVKMGEPVFDPTAIPVNAPQQDLLYLRLPIQDGELEVATLSTGTTHSVAFVDELPDDEAFFRISPQIENHSLFPLRTTLMWAKVESEDTISVRIWERGAGETWGCGTGSCATAVAGQLRGMVGQNVSIISKGGTLQIEWEPGSSIEMTGPAEVVFEGDWEHASLHV
jgi:diaminopimelate epimerase